jgi:hypothetical protein
LNTVPPSALDLYHRFVAIIDQAAADKNIYAVPAAATAAGMSGSEEPHGLGQRWNYAYSDQTGFTVLVHARWWDQSKPFSIQPDMHVMSVELRSDTTLMKHEGHYEE